MENLNISCNFIGCNNHSNDLMIYNGIVFFICAECKIKELNYKQCDTIGCNEIGVYGKSGGTATYLLLCVDCFNDL